MLCMMTTDKLKIYVPAILLALLGFGLAYQFVDPAPPSELTFSAGQKGGAYYAYAERYRDYLKERGISVKILQSSGTLDNIKRLHEGVADIAFVQSGIAKPEDSALQSLGSMYYEPLWIFMRGAADSSKRPQFLHDLKGHSIAVGLEGSGTRALAIKLLNDNGIDEHTATFLSLSSAQAAEALIKGSLDAVFIVSAASNEALQMLQKRDDIHLMNISRAEAYTRRMDSLSAITLPQGVLNLELNLPATDMQMLASTATLLVGESMHPALQGLVMQAASAIHAEKSLFSNAGMFPTAHYSGMPLSETAQHFYKSGAPFLQRFLPFWAATMVDRLKVMLLPFVALLLPLFKVMPPLYRWRIRSRIYRWYEELGAIDLMLTNDFKPSLLSDLDRIEAEVKKVHVPLSYAEELYDLRLHLALVRDQAERREGEAHKIN